jgi:hypothetical protein
MGRQGLNFRPGRKRYCMGSFPILRTHQAKIYISDYGFRSDEDGIFKLI